jgi:hypothetical protein
MSPEAREKLEDVMRAWPKQVEPSVQDESIVVQGQRRDGTTYEIGRIPLNSGEPEASSDDFCKVFRHADSQVVVLLDPCGEDGPEIQFKARPTGLGVCSVALSFEDTDEGYEKAGQVFEEIGEEQVASIYEENFACLGLAFGGGDD